MHTSKLGKHLLAALHMYLKPAKIFCIWPNMQAISRTGFTLLLVKSLFLFEKKKHINPLVEWGWFKILLPFCFSFLCNQTYHITVIDVLCIIIYILCMCIYIYMHVYLYSYLQSS